jgi:hypothetical protein
LENELQQLKLFLFILQAVGLAFTKLQLVGPTCLLAETRLKKTIKNELTTTTIDNYFYLSSR